jgi:hypothetical protein
MFTGLDGEKCVRPWLKKDIPVERGTGVEPHLEKKAPVLGFDAKRGDCKPGLTGVRYLPSPDPIG